MLSLPTGETQLVPTDAATTFVRTEGLGPDAPQVGDQVRVQMPRGPADAGGVLAAAAQVTVVAPLAETVAGSDRVFQLGTQAMSDSVWHQMKQLVQDGLIGQPLFGETGFFRIGDWGERGMRGDDPKARPGKD